MLDEVKLLLGITGTDKDELLNQIISTSERRLKNKLNGIEAVPEELKYIIVEVSVSRYNRIDSEGTSVHSTEGTSYSWLDDDFSPFLSDIEDWLLKQNKNRHMVRFI